MNSQALFQLCYGVYIVSSTMDKKHNGQIANTVFQISAEPATIGISINKNNLTHEYLQSSKKFSISVMEQDTPMTFIGKFGFKSGRDIDKFADTAYKIGTSGVPVVTDYATAYLELEVINTLDVFTHTVFIGKLLDAELLTHADPMTYAYYHTVKKGLSPKTAPTYIKPQ